MTAALSGSVFVGTACLCLTPGPQDQGPDTEVLANLFTVPAASSDGSTSCVRSSTEKNYTDALAANAVCKSSGSASSWDIACAAATGGDTVGVKPGVYSRVGVWMIGNNTNDCSDGAGADYDPNYAEKGNAPASLANWVTFVAGEDCAGTPNISFGSHINISNNRHLIIGSKPGDTTSPGGECFNFNRTIYLSDGGSASLRPQNLMFRGASKTKMMQMYGFEGIGPKNLLMENVDYGPYVQCAANDANATPAYFRCDPNGPYFESWLADFGTNIAGCTPANTGGCAGHFSQGANEWNEWYLHEGASGLYENVRVKNYNIHDGTAKGTGAGVHPGCFFIPVGTGVVAAHNLVLDSVSCERQVIGVQHAHSGVTVQNSYFACSTDDLAQTGGQYDVCAATYAVGVACREDLSPGCAVSNVLYRYNTFFGGGTSSLLFNDPASSSFGTFSNVRVIGNIFIGAPLVGCSYTGITCANNSVFSTSATGATSTTTLSCDPTIDSDATTSDNLWRESTQLDPRLNGSACGVPTLNPSSLGADYQLGFDIDDDARGASATRAGVEN
jgi:hypothetical protein